MAIPIIVLSLNESTLRRSQIASRLDQLQLPHRFFDAIDGRTLSTEQLECSAPRSALLFDQPLLPAEIGCAASHLAVLKQVAAGGDPFVCTMEDDAEPTSADLSAFLDLEALKTLPDFDVLRLVSDPARWKMPAWEVGRLGGRSVCAMARPGWGLQGQVFSRAGARKICSQVAAIRAPIDFILFHDCHVNGLRILEVRPGVIQHDLKLVQPELMQISIIGKRHEIDKQRMSTSQRRERRRWRWRRRKMAMAAFFKVWGPWAFVTQILPRGRPGTYFR